ncbi:hypothetical protein GMYAFLOJ_CDS0042 [Microbacterium phage phiMiGM15]
MTATETRTPLTSVFDLEKGDEVVLTKGNNVIREKVTTRDGNYVLDLGTPDFAPRVRGFLEAGYAMERVDALPALPTERGFYEASDRYPLSAGHYYPYYFDGSRWFSIGPDRNNALPERHVRDLGKLTLLVPAQSVPAEPAEVVDSDGDTWKRLPSGEYQYDHLTKSLDKVRRDHGPLTLPGVTV